MQPLDRSRQGAVLAVPLQGGRALHITGGVLLAALLPGRITWRLTGGRRLPLADRPAALQPGLCLLLPSDWSPGSQQVWGDSDLHLEGIDNLLDNAIKFAPTRTDVVVSLQDRADGLDIQIADGGPDIPPAECQRVCNGSTGSRKAGRSRAPGLV